MRIGIVCPYSWDAPGGVRTHISDLAETLMARGHEVSVLAPLDEDAELPDWVVDGGRPVAVPYNGSVARLGFGVKATRRVHKWVREGDFDVLHVHEPLAPSLSLLACWVANGPIVATWHSSNDRSRILSASYYIAQTAMEKLSGTIAVSDDARRTLVAHVGGDAVLVPNGVRIDQYAGEERLDGVDPDRPSVLFLGRMDEPRKGLPVLVEALPAIAAAYPDVQVLIAGPGDVDDARKDLPDLPATTTVEFLGRIDDDTKARALRTVDAYIAPHTGGESFGIVLIEAMAAGTAVVASDLPAFTRVLEDGASGVLFQTGDAHALAKATVGVLGDPALRAGLVEAGSRRVRDFDWNTVVDDVLAVYDAVTVSGEKVQTDLRGQLVGRWGGGR